MLDPIVTRLLPYMVQGALAVAVFLGFYHLLQAFVRQPRRWFQRWKRPDGAQGWIPAPVSRWLGIRPGSASLEERRRLLAASGIRLSAVDYECGRRAAIALSGSTLALGALQPSSLSVLGSNVAVWLLLASATLLIFASADRVWLQVWRRQRTYRIVREVYAVSRQLLYYAGSRMNLHAKLARCVPYTQSIRADLLDLLNDWYQDPDTALRRFRDRLGTGEGYSFVETLLSLRLNDHEAYYHLLRERLRDYKDKIELTKESRKETTSYALFILAGIPILFTFRVFVYPWVIEGQRLFESLH